MYKFKWRMTEEDWNKFKRKPEDFAGAVYIGLFCIEFSFDGEDRTVYSFVAGVDKGYGYLKDGTPYDLVDNQLNLKEALRARTFNDFKSIIEESFIDACKRDVQWNMWALTEKEINWN